MSIISDTEAVKVPSAIRRVFAEINKGLGSPNKQACVIGKQYFIGYARLFHFAFKVTLMVANLILPLSRP